MIDTALTILKNKLNEYFKIKTEEGEDFIKFIGASNNTPITFTQNTVTPFLINISEDKKFRNPDQYKGVVKNGIRTQFNPEIRIELLVLFVSNFTIYTEALRSLSYVIKFFQSNKTFTPNNTPELSDENIEKLAVELISLPLEEQNQVWHSLNTSYLPSVLYKVRLLSFADENIAFASSSSQEIAINIIEK